MSFKSSNYIFDKYRALYGSSDETTTPSNETKITASDGATDDNFGSSVAVGSGIICVGTYRHSFASGAVYVFDLDGTQLTKIAGNAIFPPLPIFSGFGKAIAVGSGRICVGTYREDDNGPVSGAAFLYDLDGTLLAKIKPSDGATTDVFGNRGSVAVGSGRIVIGAYGDDDNGSGSGSAYIFDLDGTQLAKIKASDGASNDQFGISVAVGSGRICVGALWDDDNGSNSGSAYIFDLDGTQLAKITASDGAAGDEFGTAVAVGSGRIVVSAPLDADNGTDSGSAYIFDLDGTQLAKIKASDGATSDYFGQSVAVGSGRICVGAYYEGSRAGSAYIFDLDGTQLAKITASDATSGDEFGTAVAVGSGRIVVSAPLDDDNGSDSGSAYILNTPLVKDLLDDNF